MKKFVLLVLFIVSSINISANSKLSINNKTKNVKVVSIQYSEDCYEKEVTCVVTIEVGGHTYVGYGTGMSASEACDNAYEAAHNFM